MGCRIIRGDNDEAVLYCSTTEWAFGPVFYENEGHDAVDRAEMFIEWLPEDPRKYTDPELGEKYSEWAAQEKEQWATKEKEDEFRHIR